MAAVIKSSRSLTIYWYPNAHRPRMSIYGYPGKPNVYPGDSTYEALACILVLLQGEPFMGGAKHKLSREEYDLIVTTCDKSKG